MKKKLLCLLLSLVMIVGLVPMVVFAGDDTTKNTDAVACKAYRETGEYLLNSCKDRTPIVGSTGGEWAIIGLARSGIGTQDIYDAWYQNVVTEVQNKINDKEQLHKVKSTENERVMLALTAAGFDVTNVDGHNLIQGLTDYNYLKKQGINGPIWALIALDSHDYEISTTDDETAVQATRENIIEYILGKQLATGGWALSGKTPDPDMTAMAIQALAPYYKTNSDVKSAVDNAFDVLSEIQKDNGGFASWGTVNSESCAQVIVALTALGIDPATDARFVKGGNSVIDAMCEFAVDGGGFKHTMTTGLNGMATEQAYYALASYFRFKNSQTSLYDMTDVHIFDEDHEFNYEYDDVSHWQICNCGEKSTASPHTFGEWKIITPATENSEGLMERVCPICGCKETKVIDKLEKITLDDKTPLSNATKAETTSEEEIANTADNTDIVLSVALTFASATGAAFVLASKKKNEE